MTSASLIAFRKRMGWSQTQAAEELGCSRRALQTYEQPGGKVPKVVALACAAKVYGLPPLE